jgi:hypothetical protein
MRLESIHEGLLGFFPHRFKKSLTVVFLLI